MLKRRDRLERLDEAIAEAEQRITEQAFRIMAMEARGEDTAAACRTLRAFEGILVEYHRARRAVIEGMELTGRRSRPRPAGKVREG